MPPIRELVACECVGLMIEQPSDLFPSITCHTPMTYCMLCIPSTVRSRGKFLNWKSWVIRNLMPNGSEKF